jgi:NADH-quinone oxidoreductase subunit C
MAAPLPERLQSALGLEPTLSHGMPVVQVDPAAWGATMRTLRDQLGLDMLLDLTAVDWLGKEAGRPRFEVVAHLWSSTERHRVRVKTRVTEADPTVDSLVPLYGSARFMERECHEMLGIAFRGNADLRPILLYEGFEGHPLRKDYDKHHEQPLVDYRDPAAGR